MPIKLKQKISLDVAILENEQRRQKRIVDLSLLHYRFTLKCAIYIRCSTDTIVTISKTKEINEQKRDI